MEQLGIFILLIFIDSFVQIDEVLTEVNPEGFFNELSS